MVAGQLDAGTQLAMSQAIAQQVSAARLEVIAEASHLSAIEQPARFTQLVDQFIEGL